MSVVTRLGSGVHHLLHLCNDTHRSQNRILVFVAVCFLNSFVQWRSSVMKRRNRSGACQSMTISKQTLETERGGGYESCWAVSELVNTGLYCLWSIGSLAVSWRCFSFGSYALRLFYRRPDHRSVCRLFTWWSCCAWHDERKTIIHVKLNYGILLMGFKDLERVMTFWNLLLRQFA